MKVKLVKESLNDHISDKKINKLKEIGFTSSEIIDLIKFLSLPDDKISDIKLKTLKGAPQKIKNYFGD